MFKYLFDIHLNNDIKKTNTHLLIGGFALVSFGILIILFPMMLLALISALLIGAGVVMLFIAWRLRKAAKYPNEESIFFYTSVF